MIRLCTSSLALLVSAPLVRSFPTPNTNPSLASRTTSSMDDGWSKEAISTLVGVVVAVIGVVVAVWLAMSCGPKWLCRSPMSKCKSPIRPAYSSSLHYIRYSFAPFGTGWLTYPISAARIYHLSPATRPSLHDTRLETTRPA